MSQAGTEEHDEIEAKLRAMGLELLPELKPLMAHIVRAKREGNLVFVSGHGPRNHDGSLAFKGKLGRELTADEGYQAARLACLGALSSVKRVVGSLDNVVSVVKLLVFVNSAPGFNVQPHVANGASDLLLELYGEAGQHTRAAVGMAEMPHDMPLEVEMILAVRGA